MSDVEYFGTEEPEKINTDADDMVYLAVQFCKVKQKLTFSQHSENGVRVDEDKITAVTACVNHGMVLLVPLTPSSGRRTRVTHG